MPYQVLIDDNFHYMDSSYRGDGGTFSTPEDALARCRQIVDEYLDAAEKVEGTADAGALWKSYTMFGEDPFIVAEGELPLRFSAWDYARQRCRERCCTKSAEAPPGRSEESDDEPLY